MTFWEWFILFLIYIPLLIMWGVALFDIFTRSDISGWVKALWVVGLLIFPWVGVLVYLVVRPPYVEGFLTAKMMPEATITTGVATQIDQLTKLRSQGVLTEAEYAAAKSRVIAGNQPGTKAA